MSISPLDGSGDPVNLVIYSNGKEIPDTVLIISALTQASINRAPTAKLVVQDGDLQEQDFPVSNSDTFDLGNKLEIRAGYGVNEESIFEGVIVKHRIDVSAENTSLLIVECQDMTESIDNSEQSSTHPQATTRSSLVVTYGLDLMEFSGEINAGKELNSSITSAIETQGHMKFQGSAKAKAGSAIEIVGVGKRLSGEVLICNVEHLLIEGTWITEVRFYRHAK